MTIYCLVECLVDALHAEFPHVERPAHPGDIQRLDAVYAALRKRATEQLIEDARKDDEECARIAQYTRLPSDW
jgi:hypothetical protein